MRANSQMTFHLQTIDYIGKWNQLFDEFLEKELQDQALVEAAADQDVTTSHTDQMKVSSSQMIQNENEDMTVLQVVRYRLDVTDKVVKRVVDKVAGKRRRRRAPKSLVEQEAAYMKQVLNEFLHEEYTRETIPEEGQETSSSSSPLWERFVPTSTRHTSIKDRFQDFLHRTGKAEQLASSSQAQPQQQQQLDNDDKPKTSSSSSSSPDRMTLLLSKFLESKEVIEEIQATDNNVVRGGSVKEEGQPQEISSLLVDEVPKVAAADTKVTKVGKTNKEEVSTSSTTLETSSSTNTIESVNDSLDATLRSQTKQGRGKDLLSSSLASSNAGINHDVSTTQASTLQAPGSASTMHPAETNEFGFFIVVLLLLVIALLWILFGWNTRRTKSKGDSRLEDSVPEGLALVHGETPIKATQAKLLQKLMDSDDQPPDLRCSQISTVDSKDFYPDKVSSLWTSEGKDTLVSSDATPSSVTCSNTALSRAPPLQDKTDTPKTETSSNGASTLLDSPDTPTHARSRSSGSLSGGFLEPPMPTAGQSDSQKSDATKGTSSDDATASLASPGTRTRARSRSSGILSGGSLEPSMLTVDANFDSQNDAKARQQEESKDIRLESRVRDSESIVEKCNKAEEAVPTQALVEVAARLVVEASEERHDAVTSQLGGEVKRKEMRPKAGEVIQTQSIVEDALSLANTHETVESESVEQIESKETQQISSNREWQSTDECDQTEEAGQLQSVIEEGPSVVDAQGEESIVATGELNETTESIQKPVVAPQSQEASSSAPRALSESPDSLERHVNGDGDKPIDSAREDEFISSNHSSDIMADDKNNDGRDDVASSGEANYGSRAEFTSTTSLEVLHDEDSPKAQQVEDLSWNDLPEGDSVDIESANSDSRGPPTRRSSAISRRDSLVKFGMSFRRLLEEAENEMSLLEDEEDPEAEYEASSRPSFPSENSMRLSVNLEELLAEGKSDEFGNEMDSSNRGGALDSSNRSATRRRSSIGMARFSASIRHLLLETEEQICDLEAKEDVEGDQLTAGSITPRVRSSDQLCDLAVLHEECDSSQGSKAEDTDTQFDEYTELPSRNLEAAETRVAPGRRSSAISRRDSLMKFGMSFRRLLEEAENEMSLLEDEEDPELEYEVSSRPSFPSENSMRLNVNLEELLAEGKSAEFEGDVMMNASYRSNTLDSSSGRATRRRSSVGMARFSASIRNLLLETEDNIFDLADDVEVDGARPAGATPRVQSSNGLSALEVLHE